MEYLIAIRNAVFWWVGCWFIMNAVTFSLVRFRRWLYQRKVRRMVREMCRMVELARKTDTRPRPAELFDQNAAQRGTSHDGKA